MKNSSLEHLLHVKPVTLILPVSLRGITEPFHQMKKQSLEKAPIILLACHEAQIHIKASAMLTLLYGLHKSETIMLS